MNPPDGWRCPDPRQAETDAEIFPGDAAPVRETGEADRPAGTGGPGPAPRTGGAGPSPAGSADPADPIAWSGPVEPITSSQAASGGESARRRRRRGGGRLPEGPTSGSAAAQGPPADPEAVAREICLRLLSFSPRTCAQLADALRRKGVPDDVAERVLGRYSEVGLIDDEAFARAWVESRHAGRGLARRALAAELRRRGVADETVNAAVEELGLEQEETAARELVARRLRATRGLDPVKRTRRLVGMLARKGYSGGLAYRVVREALEAEGADDLPDLSLDE